MNAILGKRQIVLATLVVALGMAVYLNWQFADEGARLAVAGDIDASKNYGDAQFVDSNVTDNQISDVDVYFAEAKLSRKKSRDEAVQSIKNMLQDSALSEEQKSELAVQAAEIIKAMESESNIESLIKAKGFSECMVYIGDQQVNVVVKTPGLLVDEVAQIRDILLAQTHVTVDNIAIVEVK